MLVEWLTLTGWVVAAVLLILGCFVAVLFYRGTRRRRPVRRAAELGKAALRDRRFGDAVKYLNVALRFAPEAVALYLRRAEAWQGLGKTRRAEADCGRAIELAKYTAQPYRVRGQIYADANELDSAIADFLRAAELDADDTESLAFAAGLLLDAGQPERAFNVASKVVHRNPEHAEGYYLRGRALERLGRFDAAFSEYTAAIQLDPHRLDLPERLAHCCKAGGEVPPEPPVALVEVPAEPPPPAEPVTAAEIALRGWQHREAGELALATDDFDRACDLDPNSADALFGRGRCREDANDPGRAADDFGRLLAVNPNLKLALFYRGRCRVQLGEYAAAAADLNRVASLDPKGAAWTYLLARLLATCPDDAVRDGPRAVELAGRLLKWSDTGEHRVTLACALAECGDFVAAVEQAQAALRDARLPEDQRAAVSSYCAEFWAGRAVRMPATPEPAVPVTVSPR